MYGAFCYLTHNMDFYHIDIDLHYKIVDNINVAIKSKGSA